MTNTAVLIDAENISHRYIDNIINKLNEDNYAIRFKYGFGDWSQSGLCIDGWKNVLNNHGIRPIHLFSNSKGKNAADIQMVITGMELLFQNPDIDSFVIVSGDGDFTPFVLYLKEAGKKVIGFGGNNISPALESACDEFFSAIPDIKNTVAASTETQDRAPISSDKLKTTCFNIWLSYFWLRNDKGWISLNDFGTVLKKTTQKTWSSQGYRTLKDLMRDQEEFEMRTINNEIYVRPHILGDDWIFSVVENSYPVLLRSTPSDQNGVKIDDMEKYIKANYQKPKKLSQYNVKTMLEHLPLYTITDDHLCRLTTEPEASLNNLFINECKSNQDKWIELDKTFQQTIQNKLDSLNVPALKSFSIIELADMCFGIELDKTFKHKNHYKIKEK